MSDDDYRDYSSEYSRGLNDYHSGQGRDWTSSGHSSGWDEAERLEAARNAHNQSEMSSGPDPANVQFGRTAGQAAGAGGAGCMLGLVVLGILLSALSTAVLALPGALLAAWPLAFLSKRGPTPLGFRQARKAGHRAIGWYLHLSLGICFATLLVEHGWSGGGIEWMGWYLKDMIGRVAQAKSLPREPARPETITWLGTLALMQVPGLLAAGRVLQKRIRVFGEGFWGYLRATGLAIVLLPSCVGLASIILYFLFQWADVAKFRSLEQFLSIGAVTCFLCVVYALLSGILLASAATGVLRMRGKGLWPGFRSGFAAIFQALLCFALATAVAMLIFRQGDPLLRWAFGVVRSQDALVDAGVSWVPLWSAFWDGFLLLIPGVLIAGAIVAERMSERTQSTFAYLSAYVATGALALLSLPPALLGTAYVLAVRTNFLAGW